MIKAVVLSLFLFLTAQASNQCIWNCANFTHSGCPTDCVQDCTSSTCGDEDMECSSDCDGPGSCRCPKPGEKVEPRQGHSALMMCLSNPKTSGCDKLLSPHTKKSDLNLDLVDHYGFNVFLSMLQNNDWKAAEEALRLGANSKQVSPTNGYNAAHVAASQGRCDVPSLKKLKEWGVDLLAKTKDGRTIADFCPNPSPTTLQLMKKEKIPYPEKKLSK